MTYESSKLTIEDEIEDESVVPEEMLTEVLNPDITASQEPTTEENPGIRQVEVRRKIEEYLLRKRNKQFEDIFTFDEEFE